jgi:chromosome segregation ATPase
MCEQSNEVKAVLERLDERMSRTIEAARQMGRYEERLQGIQDDLGTIIEATEQLGGKVNGLGARLNGIEQRQTKRDRRLGEQLGQQETLSAELGDLLAQAYRAMADALVTLKELGQEPVFTPPTGHEPSKN